MAAALDWRERHFKLWGTKRQDVVRNILSARPTDSDLQRSLSSTSHVNCKQQRSLQCIDQCETNRAKATYTKHFFLKWTHQSRVITNSQWRSQKCELGRGWSSFSSSFVHSFFLVPFHLFLLFFPLFFHFLFFLSIFLPSTFLEVKSPNFS